MSATTKDIVTTVTGFTNAPAYGEGMVLVHLAPAGWLGLSRVLVSAADIRRKDVRSGDTVMLVLTLGPGRFDWKLHLDGVRPDRRPNGAMPTKLDASNVAVITP